MRILSRTSAVALCLGVLSLCVTATAQPPFPHQYHIEEEGLGCAECHELAYESRTAADDLLPDSEMCLDCHEEGDVRLSWPAAVRDYDFDHSYHTTELGVECATCHEGLLIEAVRSTGYLPTMDSCMSCHNGGAAPRECEACHHADLAELRPVDHVVGWQDEHGPVARLSDAACMPCHAVDDCQECHDGALLVEAMSYGAARQTPTAPQLTGSAGTVLQSVHGLNFRFLHSLEARGKGSDCLVCHELDSGDFCAQCHNPAGDEGLRPAWHGGADWGAQAAVVGTGGGRHAELARQDMESCVACHDVGGEDPVCLLCHIDRNPGRGNDPRTHDSAFADDIGDGDFHDDDGANCFACHTRANTPDSFCSYCHRLR